MCQHCSVEYENKKCNYLHIHKAYIYNRRQTVRQTSKKMSRVMERRKREGTETNKHVELTVRRKWEREKEKKGMGRKKIRERNFKNTSRKRR